MEIIPAIIPQSLDDLREKLSLVVDRVPFVQIDVTDGHFVHSKSWPYDDNGEEFNRIVNGDEGLPFWDKINFEIDMMVEYPEDKIEQWISAGASRIVFHIESTKNPEIVIDHLKELGVEVGVALNIGTPAEILDPIAEKIDFIQCMGIGRIGFQGETFDEQAISKVADLKEKYPNIPISVDGGVNFENIEELRNAGATRFVVGSAIFESGDVEDSIEQFKNL
ncbi:MAG: hypothetical protein WCW87_02830 [Candidatus Paceibacterota bacterium]